MAHRYTEALAAKALSAWRGITHRLGALPHSWLIWLLALGFCSWQLIQLYRGQGVGGLSAATYDFMVKKRLWAPALDPRIVVLDIDEASLLAMGKEFGRWPWPRDTLATVLNHLEQQKPAAIVWDIVFSDADRLSPGGDKAFDAAALRSRNSVFSVVRLPAQFDAQSQISPKLLPKLWLPQPAHTGSPQTGSTLPKTASQATVALIPPVLPALAAAPMGFNNGYPDEDGVIRHYRWQEPLKQAPQERMQSLALAVARHVQSASEEPRQAAPTRMVWRAGKNSYPRVPFYQVFQAAESASPQGVPSPVLDFTNKIVVIGASASSLHDVHTTPLGQHHLGVDILATAIDNGLNQRFLADLSPSALIWLTVVLILILAARVHISGATSLHGGLVLLPSALLLISFASLHGSPIYLDLSGAAEALLGFVAAYKLYLSWRRNRWCSHAANATSLVAVAQPQQLAKTLEQTTPSRTTNTPLGAKPPLEPFAENGLDWLIDELSLHAPSLRIVGGDGGSNWPAHMLWPELYRGIAVVGDAEAVERFAHHLERQHGLRCSSLVNLATPTEPADAHKNTPNTANLSAAYTSRAAHARAAMLAHGELAHGELTPQSLQTIQT